MAFPWFVDQFFGRSGIGKRLNAKARASQSAKNGTCVPRSSFDNRHLTAAIAPATASVSHPLAAADFGVGNFAQFNPTSGEALKLRVQSPLASKCQWKDGKEVDSDLDEELDATEIQKQIDLLEKKNEKLEMKAARNCAAIAQLKAQLKDRDQDSTVKSETKEDGTQSSESTSNASIACNCVYEIPEEIGKNCERDHPLESLEWIQDENPDFLELIERCDSE